MEPPQRPQVSRPVCEACDERQSETAVLIFISFHLPGGPIRICRGRADRRDRLLNIKVR